MIRRGSARFIKLEKSDPPYPDITLLLDIAYFFGVTVDELLCITSVSFMILRQTLGNGYSVAFRINYVQRVGEQNNIYS